jgi:hypothetical protein
LEAQAEEPASGGIRFVLNVTGLSVILLYTMAHG